KTTGRGYTQTYCASPLNHCPADEVDNNDLSFVFGFSVCTYSVVHTFPLEKYAVERGIANRFEVLKKLA
ncbi:MAG: hypothetical protein II244_06665, partial [Clostridia bacterium]|nr:hypothetical protein [Clostridia bacterium]